MFWQIGILLPMTSKVVNCLPESIWTKNKDLQFRIRNGPKQIKIPKARSWVSFGPFVLPRWTWVQQRRVMFCLFKPLQTLLTPATARRPDFLHRKRGPCLFLRGSALLNAHEIFTFQGPSSNSRCHKIFVGQMLWCNSGGRRSILSLKI